MTTAGQQSAPEESFIHQWPSHPFPPPARALVHVLGMSTVMILWIGGNLCKLWLSDLDSWLAPAIGMLPTILLTLAVLMGGPVVYLLSLVWQPWRRVGRLSQEAVHECLWSEPHFWGELVEVALCSTLPEDRGRLRTYGGILAERDGWIHFAGDGCRFALRSGDIAAITRGKLFAYTTVNMKIATVTLKQPVDGVESITIEAHGVTTPFGVRTARRKLFFEVKPVIDIIEATPSRQAAGVRA